MSPVGSLTTLSGRHLQEPITYEIASSSSDHWVVWCAEFQLWGSGSSMAAAVAELTSSLAAMYQDYSVDEHLNSAAATLKARLQYLFGDTPTTK